MRIFITIAFVVWMLAGCAPILIVNNNKEQLRRIESKLDTINVRLLMQEQWGSAIVSSDKLIFDDLLKAK